MRTFALETYSRRRRLADPALPRHRCSPSQSLALLSLALSSRPRTTSTHSAHDGPQESRGPADAVGRVQPVRRPPGPRPSRSPRGRSAVFSLRRSLLTRCTTSLQSCLYGGNRRSCAFPSSKRCGRRRTDRDASPSSFRPSRRSPPSPDTVRSEYDRLRLRLLPSPPSSLFHRTDLDAWTPNSSAPASPSPPSRTSSAPTTSQVTAPGSFRATSSAPSQDLYSACPPGTTSAVAGAFSARRSSSPSAPVSCSPPMESEALRLSTPAG